MVKAEKKKELTPKQGQRKLRKILKSLAKANKEKKV